MPDAEQYRSLMVREYPLGSSFELTIVPNISSFGENLDDGKMRSESCFIAVSRWSGQFLGMSLASIRLYSSSPRPGAHSRFRVFSRMPFDHSSSPFSHGA